MSFTRKQLRRFSDATTPVNLPLRPDSRATNEWRPATTRDRMGTSRDDRAIGPLQCPSCDPQTGHLVFAISKKMSWPKEIYG